MNRKIKPLRAERHTGDRANSCRKISALSSASSKRGSHLISAVRRDRDYRQWVDAPNLIVSGFAIRFALAVRTNVPRYVGGFSSKDALVAQIFAANALDHAGTTVLLYLQGVKGIDNVAHGR